MTWQSVRQADLPRITAFLSDHIQSAMFPLANLRDHGLDGVDRRAMSVWHLTREGVLIAVFCMSREGMVMPVGPGAHPDDWRALRPELAGHPAMGAAGDAPVVRACLAALGLEQVETILNDDEPGFALALSDLAFSDDTGGSLVRPEGPLYAAMVAMRRAYLLELHTAPPDTADAKAETDVDSYIAQDSHRLLIREGAPVAMTGFNATWNDTVQIGGVFTPPELRGRGYAAQAVALHLAEAREAGKCRAQLFAASDGAARMYRRLGFRRAGTFALVLFTTTTEIAR